MLAALAPYAPWVQAAFIFLSFIAAAVAIYYSTLTARRRATIELLISECTDRDWIEITRKFVELKQTQDALVRWALDQNSTSEEFGVIKSQLNKYEMIAIGIRGGTICKRIYKRWWRTQLVADWMKTKSLVHELRGHNGNPKIFCEFEALAKSWAKNDEREKC